MEPRTAHIANATNDERPFSRLPGWEWVLLLTLFAACCLIRLVGIGDKVIMHDEALFVFYTYDQLYKQWMYSYLPILHGPAMLHLQSLTFHLFGVTDFTMRLGCALLGIAGFWWVWLMRPWLRPAGVYFALAFYTVSPGIVYYQRFFRNDSLFLFNSLWIVVSLAYWWRNRDPRWLASALAGMAVLFTNKESSLFIYFSVFTFFALLVVHDLAGSFFSSDVTEKKPGRSKIPRFPNPLWGVLLAGIAIVWVVTAVFEGIHYDDDVVGALGHDWVLKDVRSIPILLGWEAPTAEAAPDAGPVATRAFWLKFYGGLFLGLLALFMLLKFAAEGRWGARQTVTRTWTLLYASRYHILGAIALMAAIYVLVFTTFLKHKLGFAEIYSKTWSYWGGQHEWGRIGGPFHQHLLNILIYELPAVLFVAAAWIGGLFTEKWQRNGAVALLLFLIPVAAFQKLIFSNLHITPVGGGGPVPLEVGYLKAIFKVGLIAAFAVLILPRMGRAVGILGFIGLIVFSIWYLRQPEWIEALGRPVFRDGEAITLKNRHVNLRDMMNIQYNFNGGTSLALVLVLTFFATLYSWFALNRGERFQAFLVWWFVTSAGAASYAREAVPQIGIHAMLPLILLAASYFGRWYERLRPGLPRNLLLAAAAALLLWNTKATVTLNLGQPEDIRERMVYGHPSRDLKNHFDFIDDYVKIATLRMQGNSPAWLTQPNNFTQHKDVRVGIQAPEAVWPARWYLRDVEWREENNADRLASGEFHFIFVREDFSRRHPALAERYHLHRGSGLRFWLPKPLDQQRLLDGWMLLIPGHRAVDGPTAQRVENASAEWRKIFRYMTRRETFDGGTTGGGTFSSTDYAFGIRNDLF